MAPKNKKQAGSKKGQIVKITFRILCTKYRDTDQALIAAHLCVRDLERNFQSIGSKLLESFLLDNDCNIDEHGIVGVMTAERKDGVLVPDLILKDVPALYWEVVFSHTLYAIRKPPAYVTKSRHVGIQQLSAVKEEEKVRPASTLKRDERELETNVGDIQFGTVPTPNDPEANELGLNIVFLPRGTYQSPETAAEIQPFDDVKEADKVQPNISDSLRPEALEKNEGGNIPFGDLPTVNDTERVQELQLQLCNSDIENVNDLLVILDDILRMKLPRDVYRIRKKINVVPVNFKFTCMKYRIISCEVAADTRMKQFMESPEMKNHIVSFLKDNGCNVTLDTLDTLTLSFDKGAGSETLEEIQGVLAVNWARSREATIVVETPFNTDPIPAAMQPSETIKEGDEEQDTEPIPAALQPLETAKEGDKGQNTDLIPDEIQPLQTVEEGDTLELEEEGRILVMEFLSSIRALRSSDTGKNEEGVQDPVQNIMESVHQDNVQEIMRKGKMQIDEEADRQLAMEITHQDDVQETMPKGKMQIDEEADRQLAMEITDQDDVQDTMRKGKMQIDEEIERQIEADRQLAIATEELLHMHISNPPQNVEEHSESSSPWTPVRSKRRPKSPDS